jgi:aquaporin TIP
MPGSIAFGRFDDSFSMASLKAYIAEFISTLIFVFAGVGSAIAYSELLCFNFRPCMFCS